MNSRILFALILFLGAAFGEEPSLSPAPEGTFTIVAIPDTQHYLGKGTKLQPESQAPVTNPVFDRHTQWIIENRDLQRIAFVTHVGDIVDKNVEPQWEVARACMDRLHGVIPYGISVGNHDMTSAGDSSLFQRYFPAARFEEFPWYGGSFAPARPEPTVSGNNANSFQLFSAGGMDFVFLHLECNAPDDVLNWANQVLSTHASRRAIVTTHMGLGPVDRPKSGEDFFKAPKGRMQWHKIHGERGNTPQQMWEKCFSRHPNLFMICSGDQSRTTAMTQSSKGQHGNLVHELLSDYTSNGPLRLYRFVPSRNLIEVITYDTTLNQLCLDHPNVPGAENHQFTLPYLMTAP